MILIALNILGLDHSFGDRPPIILDGDKGSGFSCQAELAVTLRLPEMLENIAKQIRESK